MCFGKPKVPALPPPAVIQNPQVVQTPPEPPSEAALPDSAQTQTAMQQSRRKSLFQIDANPAGVSGAQLNTGTK